MKLQFVAAPSSFTGTVAYPIAQPPQAKGSKSKTAATAKKQPPATPILSEALAKFDQDCGGFISHALKISKFYAKFGEALTLIIPPNLGKIKCERIILFGLGAVEELTPPQIADLGGSVAAVSLKNKSNSITVHCDLLDELLKNTKVANHFKSGELVAEIALGFSLRCYRFDKYQTQIEEGEKPQLSEMVLATSHAKAAQEAWSRRQGLVEAITYSRNLVAEPPNVLNPVSYCELLKKLKIPGLTVEILDDKKLAQLKMGALLGVGLGSPYKARIAILSWNGGAKNAKPIAFVGKGVTFDSGGLSLKPAKSMEDMKWDMAGSAAVVGALIAVATRKAKANVVGVVGLVENMPDGVAQRPGDIVTSYSGQTIEVLNTDAEGRLVLADALAYTEKSFKPEIMIDLATLTGAIITALGYENAGLFSNDSELAANILRLGEEVGETVWQLPMSKKYDKLIDSDIADMKNIGDGTSGSIVGAQFLGRFVKDTKWAHLDIAGMAWGAKDRPTVPKGATGWGVRLLDRIVRNYEK